MTESKQDPNFVYWLKDWRKSNTAPDGAVRLIASQANLETEILDNLIDKAQQEVNEQYVKLPVDLDGTFIHVGDMTDKGKVAMISFDGMDWYVKTVDNDYYYYPNDLHHVNPRTVEDVLFEFADQFELIGMRADKPGSNMTLGDIEKAELECVRKYAAELQMVGDAE